MLVGLGFVSMVLSKELLGIIRSKYGSIPIPNGETNLDGDTLEVTSEKTTNITIKRRFRQVVNR